MSGKQFGTWEEAVEWLIAQPDQRELVKACYYDRPVLHAAQRFWKSEEWCAIKGFFPTPPGKALDVGAGNGIASFALAKDGWHTTALEPDSSDKVGSGAIKKLAKEAKLNITVVQEYGEWLPFTDATFDFIHARQVLHHANDLGKFCKELFRVLRPNGILIATREHVISHENQLSQFRKEHPLHMLYGGENAFRLPVYKRAFQKSGFKFLKVMGPFDSVINYAPFTRQTLKEALKERIAKFPGGMLLAKILLQDELFEISLKLLSFFDRRPGRLFSFVVQK